MNGVTGQNALLNVEEEIRQETGPALILLQLTVVLNVREMLRKNKPATKIPAPVSVKIRLYCYSDSQKDMEFCFNFHKGIEPPN